MQRDEVSAENKSASHYIKPLHLVSRDQSDCFALLNVPLITCEAVEGIQIRQLAIA